MDTPNGKASPTTADDADTCLHTGRLMLLAGEYLLVTKRESIVIPTEKAVALLETIATYPYRNCRLLYEGLPVAWDGKRVILRVKP